MPRNSLPTRALARVFLVVALAIAGAALPGVAVAAIPAPVAVASDPRADFFPGNATTCAQVGFAEAVRIGGVGDAAGQDAYVSVATRDTRYVDVAITPAGTAAGVVIDGVVVKGGDGFNLYTNPAVLPPAAAPPQGFFSPYVGVGNIPRISHWFVCYHFDDLPTGSLLVLKSVIPPDGIPADPLPASFAVLVECDAAGFESILVSFSALGGVSVEVGRVLIEDIPVGTTCTLEELGVASLPPGTDVTISPAPTVVIGGTEGITAAVVNDFTETAILQQTFTVTKVVVTQQPDQVPDSFAIDFACTDGTSGTLTLPGAGGISDPVTVTAGTYCALLEPASNVPPGWTVTYQFEGQNTEDGLIFPVFETPITATVTNTAPTPSPSPPPSPSPSLGPSPEPSGTVAGEQPELAPSGAAVAIPLLLAAGLLGAGGAVATFAARDRVRRR